MTRAELLSSKGYWIATLQIDLYHQLETFMKENNINRTQLAERLGVSKGYISQVLNGDFDHKISKLVDLSLLMGKVPELTYTNLNEYIQADSQKGANQFDEATAVIKEMPQNDQLLRQKLA